MKDLLLLSGLALAEKIRRREVSSTEVVDAHIRQVERVNPSLNAMVRTRFATPTIGREWMIGQLGTAVGDVSPEGVVTVSGARWRARTNRSTPLHAGDSVRVVAIDGVTLEVEPESGGARDYRERRRSTGGDVAAEP